MYKYNARFDFDIHFFERTGNVTPPQMLFLIAIGFNLILSFTQNFVGKVFAFICLFLRICVANIFKT